MRRLAVYAIIFACITTLSCKKEATTPPGQGPPKSAKKMNAMVPDKCLVSLAAEGYLHFSSPEAFDQVMESLSNASDEQLDNWEHNLNFTSGYTYYNIKIHQELGRVVGDPEFKNAVYEDEMVLRFTNRKGIVQIGDYLFKLEMDNGYILQMYAEDKKALFTDFENGIFVKSSMNKLNNTLYKENESIWDLLAQHPTSMQPMGIIGTIRECWGDRVKHVEDGTTASIDQGWRYKVIGSFQDLKFYRSVVIKFQYTKDGNPLPQRTVMNLNVAVGSPIQTWGRIYNDWKPFIKAPAVEDFLYDGSRRFETKWRMYEGGTYVINGADISLYVNYEDRNDGVFREMYYYWEKPL